MNEYNEQDTIVIGAGAAGLMAAGSIACGRVLVLERNEKAGKKIYITGKGRCNVTNDCSPEEFLRHVVANPKFLYSAAYGFTSADTQALLQQWGVPTKTERGNRVFPVSDKASDVTRALLRRAQDGGATVRYNEHVRSVQAHADGFTVRTDENTYRCKRLLIATGGKSYPSTGSTGDGYTWAKALGHTVIEPRPSLVPLLLRQDVSDLAGLSLKNVNVCVTAGNHMICEFGEMLFMHDGISGPAVLRLSAYARDIPLPWRICIDCKPALDAETLDRRITSDFAAVANKQLKNALDRLLPKALIPYVLRQSGVDENKKVNAVTKAERLQLGHAVQHLAFDVTGTQSFESAVVTAGGVDVAQVDPKTMESKLVKNLYFAGEVLNVDALTGGFNLQIAFSTAHAAAKAINTENE